MQGWFSRYQSSLYLLALRHNKGTKDESLNNKNLDR